MTREEALSRLQEISDQTNRDEPNIAGAHRDADGVLVDLLKSLGYEDVVEAWDAIDKWYA